MEKFIVHSDHPIMQLGSFILQSTFTIDSLIILSMLNDEMAADEAAMDDDDDAATDGQAVFDDEMVTNER